MGFTWWQFMLIAVVVMLFFGRGKISEIMGDVAQGTKSFRKGLRDDDDSDATDATAKSLENDAGRTAQAHANKQTQNPDKAS